MTELRNDDDWQRFSPALASVLARMPAWSNIAIEAGENRWIAFLMSDHFLACELVGNDYLAPPHQLTPDNEHWLLLDGWGPPQRGHSWTRFQGWPARISAYRDLTTHIVATMREVLNIVAPGELTVTGWPGNPDQAPNLDLLGITTAIDTRAR
ncbi:hypothetical protein ACFVUS_24480 [Nocardia sp. NPDC058058]|uniref:TY-Chap domain-containing protein n=1 Tax=Nocardia sp. NPDC058058 TaxID=3346317 RepID=UPI0036DBB537